MLRYHAFTANTGLSTTVTVDITGHVQVNDAIVLAFNGGGGGGATLTFPSGFTHPGAFAKGNIACSWGTNTGDCQTKVATGSETTLTVTSSQNDFLTASVWVFGGRGATPFVVAPVQTGPVGSAAIPVSYSITGLTANGGDDLLLVVPNQSQAIVTDTLGFTQPAGWTGTATEYLQSLQGSPAISSCYLLNAGAGATGTLTGTITNSGGHSTGYIGYVISMAGGPTATWGFTC